MAKFFIVYETDFCDDFADMLGTTVIEADTEEQARKKFRDSYRGRIFITKIERMDKNV
jgi:hypothetical protein